MGKTTPSLVPRVARLLDGVGAHLKLARSAPTQILGGDRSATRRNHEAHPIQSRAGRPGGCAGGLCASDAGIEVGRRLGTAGQGR